MDYETIVTPVGFTLEYTSFAVADESNGCGVTRGGSCSYGWRERVGVETDSVGGEMGRNGEMDWRESVGVERSSKEFAGDGQQHVFASLLREFAAEQR